MPKVLMGLRRLYLSPGCSLELPASVERALGGCVVRVTTTMAPSLGVSQVEETKANFLTHVEVHQRHRIGGTPAETGYQGYLFTEIICGAFEDFDDEVVAAARAKKVEAAQTILRRLDAIRGRATETLDLVAGTIALSVHLQLVRRLLCEEDVALIGEECLARSFAGTPVEVMLRVRLNSTLQEATGLLIDSLNNADAAVRRACSEKLRWLLRAWDDPSPVGRFLGLFVPIEMILGGVGKDSIPPSAAVLNLQAFISKTGGPEAGSLQADLAKVVGERRPSLVDRFAVLARQTKHSRVEEDIKAFRQFNKIRNNLLHQGEHSYSPVIEVEQEVVADLEDLVERYLSFALFGDTKPFVSRFRHKSAEVDT